MHSPVPLVLLLPQKFREDVVERATRAGLALAVARSVALGKVECADEGVVDDGLEDDGHEAGLAHVVEATEACDGARGGGGVGGEEAFSVFVRFGVGGVES